MHALSGGVEWKLDMVNQVANKNDKPVRSSIKQPKYHPPGRKNQTLITKEKAARGVSDTADKFASLAISSQRQSLVQLGPPPMRAGVQWSGESKDMFLRSSQHFQHGGTCTRKVVG
uniref:Cyclin-dependent kinase F-4 n=2 Tax=Rhizophora mucronata TaxID=61149 RepID=A0A2P2JPD9_RHIMU